MEVEGAENGDVHLLTGSKSRTEAGPQPLSLQGCRRRYSPWVPCPSASPVPGIAKYCLEGIADSSLLCSSPPLQAAGLGLGCQQLAKSQEAPSL